MDKKKGEQEEIGKKASSAAKYMEIQIGDIVTLKKQHPCGSKQWEVLRVGMDFRLKCKGCEHQVMIPRKQLEKNVKKITPGTAQEEK